MIEIGYISDKGRCRELNEDALLVLPKEGIFVVADGVGGNNSGELASGETDTDYARVAGLAAIVALITEFSSNSSYCCSRFWKRK